MVQYGDSTVYFSRIGDRHLRYPRKLRSFNVHHPTAARISASMSYTYKQGLTQRVQGM